MDLPRAWIPTHRLMRADGAFRHVADVRIVHHADAIGPALLA